MDLTKLTAAKPFDIRRARKEGRKFARANGLNWKTFGKRIFQSRRQYELFELFKYHYILD